jgi:hypothetical protein
MYHKSTQEQSITIKVAGDGDSEQVRRLAERDSAGVPCGELLVAMVGDQVRAAISLSTGRAIADPFHRTAELVGLLRERVAQVRGQSGWRTTGFRFAPTSSMRRTGVV